jgi:hypothetical protein
MYNSKKSSVKTLIKKFIFIALSLFVMLSITGMWTTVAAQPNGERQAVSGTDGR